MTYGDVQSFTVAQESHAAATAVRDSMNRSDDSPNENDFKSHSAKKQKNKKKPWRRCGLTYSETGKSLEFKDQFGSLPQQRKRAVRKAVGGGTVPR